MANFRDLESMRAATAAAKAAAEKNRPLSKRDIIIGGPQIRYRSYERASDAETDSSVDAQRRHNDQRGAEHQWTRIEEDYVDNNRPASWRAKPGSREEYERLLRDMADDPGDVLVFFEMARSGRDMEVYVKLRKFCERNGPHFLQVGKSLYDVRDPTDKQALYNLASQAEGGSDAISRAVSPAMEDEAELGRPHATPPFGYIRGPRPSKKTPPNQKFDDDTTGRDWCPADVVREIFATYHSAGSMVKLAEKYNRLGIPTPRRYGALLSGDPERIKKTDGHYWAHKTFRHILGNPHYVGVRMRKGLIASEEANWEPLIDRGVFDAVQRRKNELARTGTVPSRAKTLLTYLAVCSCGNRELFHHTNKGVYMCRAGDASIPRALADDYVEKNVFRFFDMPGVAERFQPDDSEERKVAASRAAKIREDLDGWRKIAQNPLRTDYGLADYNEYAEKVLPELGRLEKEAARTEISPTVQKMLGGGAEARWKKLTLPQQRDVLSLCWRIEIHPVGKGRGGSVPVENRVTMTAIF
jgi:DNA invertase Pin-like site-specific DNA recombinase